MNYKVTVTAKNNSSSIRKMYIVNNSYGMDRACIKAEELFNTDHSQELTNGYRVVNFYFGDIKDFV
jgi:hypothetical protein